MPDSSATPRSTTSASVPDGLAGLVDDAALFPPGNSPLDDALAAWHQREAQPWRRLVGSFVVADHLLPDLGALVRDVEEEIPVSVVVGAGAGGVAPAASAAARTGGLRLVGVEVALRDTDDLAGNARRVVTAVEQARDRGALDEGSTVHVELPQGDATHGWLSAADEVAAREDLGLRLKFRTGGLQADLFPSPEQLASWIEAALDRETPFKCTAGLHHALRHVEDETGLTHHGFLNVLAATRSALDGGDAPAVLAEQDPATVLATLPDAEALDRTRRWFTSFGSCSVLDPLTDLVALGLVAPTPGSEDPA